ncbi:histone-lysine N-methyltransferase SETMAR [Trichonephila clavipes]|nr:histone-lysine N-methyltransferase SETMAR [Trichonephila clavipes]
MMDRISICKTVAKRNEIDPFLKRMVTGDDKWVTYDNIARRRSWSKCGEAALTVAKPGQTARKLATDQKWPGLANRRGAVFSEESAALLTSVVTRQKLWELGSEVLMHSPYIPDLAPNDYHLFLALQNFLSEKKLGSREDCENRLLDFFANKGQDCYERGNMKKHLKWKQIMPQNGTYLTQIGQSEKHVK